MMKCIVVMVLALAAVVTAVGAVDFFDLVKEEWNTFKLEHGKNYEGIEDHFRMEIFAENRHKIAIHNQKYEMGLVSFTLKPNKYSDMQHLKFTQIMNGFNRTAKHHNGAISNKRQQTVEATFIAPAHVTLEPEEVDWRKEGAVTEVKDQGECASGWAFSTTGSLEGQQYLKSGFLVSLSEQNLIDCMTDSYGNYGCNGGVVNWAFKYIHDNKGIDSEKSYPYEGIENKFDRRYVGADVGDYFNIREGDERMLKYVVATFGPVSVTIDASQEPFQLYSSGVYYDENCSSKNVNHGALVVGYGTDEKGGDYWLVKNSYGSSWGINGYIKIARNGHNHCGIATRASIPLVL